MSARIGQVGKVFAPGGDKKSAASIEAARSVRRLTVALAIDLQDVLGGRGRDRLGLALGERIEPIADAGRVEQRSCRAGRASPPGPRARGTGADRARWGGARRGARDPWQPTNLFDGAVVNLLEVNYVYL